MLLSVEGLNVELHTPHGVAKAINDLSLQVSAGQCLAIVGESGSGKSVSMLTVLGLIPQPPAKILSGRITFSGIDMLGASESVLQNIRGGRIGMVFQDPMSSLNPVMTVSGQITETLRRHSPLSRTQAVARAVELLALVGIASPEQRLKDYPHQFSGGMRQRVMIAIALANNPELLIADEPTTALDVTIQAQIITLIRDLQSSRDMGMIWITHDMGVVARVATHVMVMYAGRVMERAPVHSLFDRPMHPYTMGLLRSMPRIDRKVKGKLWSIEGLPPNLMQYPKGCPFYERCPYRADACLDAPPLLRQVGDEHYIACVQNVST